MANAPLTPSTMELANSLTQEDIPIKLRCASCNRLALNAFRLPCCEQNICETCQSTLPEACPVCSHSPLHAKDTKPLKTLRLTVMAFLRNIEKRREKERAGNQTETPALATPATAATPAAVLATKQESPKESAQASGPTEPAQESNTASEDAAGKPTTAETAAGKAAPEDNSGNTEPQLDDQEKPAEAGQELAVEEEKVQDVNASGTAPSANEQAGWMQPKGQMAAGFNNQDFTGMNWNDGFNPMMQMPQNWNGYGMMGFPGMIDPTGMFGGLGMGMGGMNPGMMNMNDMSGMMGMDYSSGYNSWNGAQMNGDFGPSGFYPNGGFNQSHAGSYRQMHQQYPKNNSVNQNHFPGRNGVSHRGRGRGHGNFGHGYGHSFSQTGGMHSQGPTTQAEASETQDAAFHHQLPAAVPGKQASSEKGADRPETAESTGSKEKAEENATHDGQGKTKDADPDAGKAEDAVPTQNEDGTVDQHPVSSGDPLNAANIAQHNNEMGAAGELPANAPIPYEEYPDQAYTQDYMHHGRGYRGDGYGRNHDFQGGFHGRGGWRGRGRGFRDDMMGHQPIEPRVPGPGVEGAPTGPRAMREGNVHRGRGGHFGRGGVAASIGSAPRSDGGYARDAHGDANDRRSRSRSRHRSRSPKENPYRRQRSTSADSYDRKHEKRSRRKYDDDEKDREYYDRKERDEPRSRDHSRESAHRSRRDKEKEKHRSRHRETSRERHQDTSRHRHRHRSREHSPEKQPNNEVIAAPKDHNDETADAKRKSKDKYRDRSYDRSYDRDRRDRTKDKDRERDRDRGRDHRDRERDRDRDRKRRPESSRPRDPSPRDPDRHHRSRRREKDRSHERCDENDERSDREGRDAGDVERPHDHVPSTSKSRRASRDRADAFPQMQPPAGPKSQIKIKPLVAPSGIAACDDTAPPTPASASASATPVDPYQLEREARHRERMLKEEQRRASLHGGERGGSWSAISAKYEDEEGSEERARRVEREREAARWRD
ncbi:hypothetical protein EJ06DRAFT_581740 [Trichodelitschia bisporula]|uniref:RING-type domain-containing protein n=1 Tax=Trichodelitschia bisporula TaxID=703511 RepID=A0A6G1HY33_9PEZI|nr:hypothetical protein EJ06DRAFT_581740 [Trichodelitschia bisporula]